MCPTGTQNDGRSPGWKGIGYTCAEVEGDKLRVKGLNGEPNVMVVGGSADDMDVYVDGKKVDKSEFTMISPEDIGSVTVTKGENPSILVITRKK